MEIKPLTSEFTSPASLFHLLVGGQECALPTKPDSVIKISYVQNYPFIHEGGMGFYAKLPHSQRLDIYVDNILVRSFAPIVDDDWITIKKYEHSPHHVYLELQSRDIITTENFN